MVFLIYASYRDLKTRTVDNWVWHVMAWSGFLIMEYQFFTMDFDQRHILFTLPALILFMFFLTEDYIIYPDGWVNWPWLGLLGVATVMVIYGIFVDGLLGFNHGDNVRAFLIIIVILVSFMFFQIGLIPGGADAKAIMAMAFLIPVYPEIGGFPLLSTSHISTGHWIIERVFPPAITVLFNAVLFMVAIPVAFLIYNISKGDLKFPACLFGHTMDLSQVPKKHVWLMEGYEEDRHVWIYFPSRRKGQKKMLRTLERKGHTRVWITPKFPFMVPLAMGYLSVFLLGNIMFYISSLPAS